MLPAKPILKRVAPLKQALGKARATPGSQKAKGLPIPPTTLVKATRAKY
jgi:hypothetical protein